MITLSTLHDPEGRFLPLLKENREALKKNFGGAIVAHTSSTDKEVLSYLKSLGFVLISGGKYSESKKEALKLALKKGENAFFFCDLDKILHWLKMEREELEGLLDNQDPEDSIILGRSKKVTQTYPISWQKTEDVVNNLLSDVFGFEIDALAAACLFNKRSAEVIIAHSTEKEWGSPIEWPLLVHLAGLKVGYRKARGLSWEDPDRFPLEIQKSGGLIKWNKLKYNSASEWKKRVAICLEQILVLERLGGF